MRLISKKILIGAALSLCISASALPLGNPADPILYSKGLFLDGCRDDDDCCNPCGGWLSSINFRFGYYGDFVFNRHLKRGSGYIDNTRFQTNAALLVLNLCHRLDIFSTLGSTRATSETQSNASLVFSEVFGFTPRLSAEYGPKFSWSVGARATLWECGCTSLGIEGQYFRTNLSLSRATLGGLQSIFPSVESRYREWQVGLGVAHRINFLIPYTGIKWSRARQSLENPGVLDQTFPDAKNGKHWGYVFGATVLSCNTAGVTVEGRLGDEKALHVNGQIRF